MKRIRPVLLATMVILTLVGVRPTPPAGALSATSSVDSRLRLEWEVGSRHGGRPVILRDRAYFEVPVKTAGASYRVSITAFDWKDCGGGGGGM